MTYSTQVLISCLLPVAAAAVVAAVMALVGFFQFLD